MYKIISLPLHILLSLVYGKVSILILTLASLAASPIGILLAVFLLCTISFMLSRWTSKIHPHFFWFFGLCYIILPMVFIQNSEWGSESARLIWFGIFFAIYIASIIGGIIGKNDKNLTSQSN